jgi:hypothetical protein
MTLKRFYDWNVFFLYSAKLNKLLVLNTPQKKSFPSKQKSVILSNKSKMDLTSKSIGLVPQVAGQVFGLRWSLKILLEENICPTRIAGTSADRRCNAQGKVPNSSFKSIYLSI